MGIHNHSDASMSSSYLDEFRKRKNELLAAEISNSESHVGSDRKLPKNSVYLENFRRRKNKLLAEELNIHEETPMYMPSDQQKANGAPKKTAAEGGRFRSSGRPAAQSNGKPSEKTAVAFSPADKNGVSLQPNIPANDSKKNAKILLILCLVTLSVIGIVFFSNMKKAEKMSAWGKDISLNEKAVSRSDHSQEADSSAPESDDSSTTAASQESTASSTETTTAAETERMLKALRPGTKNDDVLSMQKRLAELGYITEVSCTGYYGDYTKKRLKLFQRKAGLDETGIANVATLERLYADDAPKR